MAESGRFGNVIHKTKENNAEEDTLCLFNAFCVFISLVTILADAATGTLVLAEYFKNGFIGWALLTLSLIVVSNLIINMFSIRWMITDGNAKKRHWFTHCLLLGFLERYVVFLQRVFSCKTWGILKDRQLIKEKNDLTLLHFLYTFMGILPQIHIQAYAILMLDMNHGTKVIYLCVSLSSLVWSCASYICSATLFQTTEYRWTTVCLKLFWHLALLASRMCAILLFAVNFDLWTLLPLGLHWIGMTIWIITQKTSFCPNRSEESFYNIIMGFVYCFLYINLRDGKARYRLIIYYTVIISQNFASALVSILINDIEERKRTSLIGAIIVVLGSTMGVMSMVLYYRKFHEKGPLKWTGADVEMELNNKASNCNNNKTNLTQVRSFKSQKIANTNVAKEATNDTTGRHNANKKFLVDNLAFRSGSPILGGNDSMELSRIEICTVAANTPQSIINERNTINKGNPRRSSEFNSVKLSSTNSLESALDGVKANTINKRRGICSSDELKDDLNSSQLKDILAETTEGADEYNKKCLSDSIDLDLDLSFSDINSSDINTFNENIVQKLCFSALKNIKDGNQDADIDNIQKIALDILKEMYDKSDEKKHSSQSGINKSRDLDTPTEVLTVHDYENICAVNIAREAWGLRSWNGYYDIENWLHDGSVVRDRRRDTLTSASSEISSCVSQDLKNAILSAMPFPKKSHTYSNVFVRFDKSSQDFDYVNTEVSQIASDETFLARPCIVDNKDLSHLEPILEELDDLNDFGKTKKIRNTESSLVATIDEIRKVTVTNSPRNLYHRRDMWDSPQFNPSTKIETNLKRALWKEPSKFNYNNIMELVPEKKEDIAHGSKSNNFKTKDTNGSKTLSASRKSLTNGNFGAEKIKCNNVENKDVHDLSNTDIDLLWKLVSEKSLSPSSTENLSLSQKTSSLQSLLSRDVNTTKSGKSLNIKKPSKSKPRRKFSILREKFEPRAIKKVQEQTSQYQSRGNFVNVRNKLDDFDDYEMYSEETPDTYPSIMTTPKSRGDRDDNKKTIVFSKQVPHGNSIQQNQHSIKSK